MVLPPEFTAAMPVGASTMIFLPESSMMRLISALFPEPAGPLMNTFLCVSRMRVRNSENCWLLPGFELLREAAVFVVLFSNVVFFKWLFCLWLRVISSNRWQN
jgi:hypothetical protein